MKLAILAICVAVAAAKPHIYLYGGPAPVGSDGRVIDTPEVALAKAEHIAALAAATAITTGHSYPIPATAYGVDKSVAGYQGPPAPLAEVGRGIDWVEAPLKVERLASLEEPTAAAASAEASAAAYAKAHTVYGAPITMAQIQQVPTFIMAEPIVAPVHQAYSGPSAPLGEDGRVIDTEEVAKLKAEHLAALDEANAAAAAYAAACGSSTATFSAEGYTYSAPIVQNTETIVETPIIKTVPVYNGPTAPLGQDGRVIDTEEVAQLKVERLAALDQATAAAIASAAASGYSTAPSDGYTYNVPAVKFTETIAEQIPVTSAHQVYNGPAAPLGADGRVIDTEEVAKLKSEHLAALDKANAAAAAYAAACGSSMTTFSSEGYTYSAPIVHNTIVKTPIIKPVPVYNGPTAPLGQDGRVIDTEEVAQLKVERLAALDQATAAAIASAAASGYSTAPSEGYTYNVPAVKFTETIAEQIPVTSAHQVYNGPAAPLGEDGRVIDTEEVAQLKVERLAALDQAAAAAIASAAASGYSTSSSEGYTYNVPAVKFTETIAKQIPVTSSHQVYNGPAAPLGKDGRVIDTEEVAKLKAEHLAALNNANAAAAAYAAACDSSMTTFSSEGYTYSAPIVKDTIVETPVASPQQVYSGPPAPLGKDGRVIDTEEVAKLKAEHLAALSMANAAAAAYAEACGSSVSTISSGGYTYNAPIVKDIETTPIKPQQVYNGSPAPIGQDGRVVDTEEVAKLKAEHIATLEQANKAAAASAASSTSSSSSEGYYYRAPTVVLQSTYGAPAIQHSETIVDRSTALTKPHQIYNGPLAPIGEDGRVIDTEEVSRLKAEHLATLNEAIAASAALEATSGSSSSSDVASQQAAIVPATTYGSPSTVQTLEIPVVPAAIVPQQTYGGPLAPLSEDGRVVDTDEVAQLKAEHLATLAQANAEASAATASSQSSSEIVYGAPVVQQIQTFVAAAPIAKPSTYYGPPAPLSGDGQVIDTDEVASLKAEHLATLAEATSRAIADASAEIIEKPEVAIYSPALPSVRPLRGFTGLVAEMKPVTIPATSHAIVQRVIRRRPAYTGPLAPLGVNGRVVDTEEVAKLKEERLATLRHATSFAIRLAQAQKAATGQNQ